METDRRPHLLEEIYAELRSVAMRAMASERHGHTLQPTALVHEAYLRLRSSDAVGAMPRHELIALATTVIRRILVDHARRRAAQRRSAGQPPLSILAEESPVLADDGIPLALDVLAVDDALARLETIDPRKAHVVQLRFFGGLGNEEIAAHLGVTTRTVTNDWSFARAWLRRELHDDAP